MPKAIKRDLLIDSLRGLMLVIMTLDHSALFLYRYTNQTFGFFGAAIGFIFLSGYIYGVVYSRYIEQAGELMRKNYKRLFLLYKYHLVSFFFLLILHFVFVRFFQFEVLKKEHLNIVQDPNVFFRFLLLLKRPPFFDILPLYIGFFLFAPLVLLGINRGWAKQILGLSFLIWLPLQFAGVQLAFENFQNNLNFTFGAFDFFTWQFLFVISLMIGYNQRIPFFKVRYRSGRMRIVFLLLLVVFLLRQYGQHVRWSWVINLLQERTYLALPRLLSFFLMVYFIGGLNRKININKVNYFAFLGQHSIDVFVFHLILVLPLKAIDYKLAELPPFYHMGIALAILFLLMIPAILKNEVKAGKDGGFVCRMGVHFKRMATLPIDVFRVVVFTIKSILELMRN